MRWTRRSAAAWALLVVACGISCVGALPGGPVRAVEAPTLDTTHRSGLPPMTTPGDGTNGGGGGGGGTDVAGNPTDEYVSQLLKDAKGKLSPLISSLFQGKATAKAPPTKASGPAIDAVFSSGLPKNGANGKPAEWLTASQVIFGAKGMHQNDNEMPDAYKMFMGKKPDLSKLPIQKLVPTPGLESSEKDDPLLSRSWRDREAEDSKAEEGRSLLMRRKYELLDKMAEEMMSQNKAKYMNRAHFRAVYDLSDLKTPPHLERLFAMFTNVSNRTVAQQEVQSWLEPGKVPLRRALPSTVTAPAPSANEVHGGAGEDKVKLFALADTTLHGNSSSPYGYRFKSRTDSLFVVDLFDRVLDTLNGVAAGGNLTSVANSSPVFRYGWDDFFRAHVNFNEHTGLVYVFFVLKEYCRAPGPAGAGGVRCSADAGNDAELEYKAQCVMGETAQTGLYRQAMYIPAVKRLFVFEVADGGAMDAVWAWYPKLCRTIDRRFEFGSTPEEPVSFHYYPMAHDPKQVTDDDKAAHVLISFPWYEALQPPKDRPPYSEPFDPDPRWAG